MLPRLLEADRKFGLELQRSAIGRHRLVVPLLVVISDAQVAPGRGVCRLGGQCLFINLLGLLRVAALVDLPAFGQRLIDRRHRWFLVLRRFGGGLNFASLFDFCGGERFVNPRRTRSCAKGDFRDIREISENRRLKPFTVGRPCGQRPLRASLRFAGKTGPKSGPQRSDFCKFLLPRNPAYLPEKQGKSPLSLVSPVAGLVAEDTVEPEGAAAPLGALSAARKHIMKRTIVFTLAISLLPLAAGIKTNRRRDSTRPKR